jgi:Heterokaryon incompatibility protein (HET)
MEPYKYGTLPNNHSIRMLTLLAGSGDDPLRGELVDFDTNDLGCESCEPYEPLSYFWGNPERIHNFICGSQTLKLTSSLYDALRRLRLADKDRRVWADQICINQDNVGERGEQVKFMNSIYKYASHVLVWLGMDERDEAEVAFGLVKSLAETFADNEKYEKFEADHTGKNLDLCSKEDWAPMKHLTDLPWVSEPVSLYLPRLVHLTDMKAAFNSLKEPGSSKRLAPSLPPPSSGAPPPSTGMCFTRSASA